MKKKFHPLYALLAGSVAASLTMCATNLLCITSLSWVQVLLPPVVVSAFIGSVQLGAYAVYALLSKHHD